MRKIRRIRITVETERLMVISERGRTVEGWCGGCDDTVELIRPVEAAALCGISFRMISRQIEKGVLHYVETSDGVCLICLNSLLQ